MQTITTLEPLDGIVPRLDIDGAKYLRMKEIAEIATSDIKAPIASKMAAEFRKVSPHLCLRLYANQAERSGFYVAERDLPSFETYLLDPSRQKMAVSGFHAVRMWQKTNAAAKTLKKAEEVMATKAPVEEPAKEWRIAVPASLKQRIQRLAKEKDVTIGEALTLALDAFDEAAKGTPVIEAPAAPEPAKSVTVEPSSEERLRAAEARIGVSTVKALNRVDERINMLDARITKNGQAIEEKLNSLEGLIRSMMVQPAPAVRTRRRFLNAAA